ncbi:MAG TPA: glycine betaine ABC transporter substrate-binding protein [Solirubrobacteraceae bacterium]|jgi:osmoprotectant transport system substrate-binding protein|nr:glycine betaine ABC transporter substrate-binding protein [Solirubrobacteraceae bacterium]
MYPPIQSRSTRRLLAAIAVALLCAACGNATGAPSAATLSSSDSTSTASTSSVGTGTGTATTSTTPALPGTGRPAITVGDKNYTEQFVLGQLYVQALTAQGFTATLNQNIGPTQVTVQALKAGSLSMYPEYLNVFNSAVAGYTHGFHNQLDAYQAAQHYALGHGLQLLAPTPFSDTDALAVTDAYAAQNQLRTIGDLRKVAKQLTIGGAPQFQQDSPGLPSIAQAYGVIPAAFKALAVGAQYAELNAAVVQAAYVNTTDAELATGDYQLLGDPRQIFGSGNVVPVVAAKVLAEEGPAFVDVIQRVDEKLTIDAIRQMNEAVDIAQQDPATVAKQFLETHGLLTPGVY